MNSDEKLEAKIAITNDNYYSKDVDLQYMSVSQFKNFAGTTVKGTCEKTALDELNGVIQRKQSKAMLVGSYVDSYVEGTLDVFRQEHPEIFKKTGDHGLLADFKQAEDIIARMEREPGFLEYLSGKKQEIMTADLFGATWKIKMDSYLAGDKIVDLKVMKDMAPIRDAGKVYDFIRYYGYDIQGAVYQKVVELVTGQKLPFYLAVITKEATPDLQVIELDQEYLDEALTFVEENIGHVLDVKEGRVAPTECGFCANCRNHKHITAPVKMSDFIKNTLPHWAQPDTESVDAGGDGPVTLW